MQLLKLNNLIFNRLLYNRLEEICSHDSILVLILIAYLVTPLDRVQWQYTAFLVDIKIHCFQMFEYPGTILSFDHVSFGRSLLFFFIPINN